MRTMLLIGVLFLTLGAAQTATAAGMDSQPAPVQRDPDYDNGKQALEAKDWKLAAASFKRALAREPNNPDIHSYLGYVHRKAGDFDAAFKSYGEALRLDPRHKGAHEYLGEAYLDTNNLAKAEEHLAALDRICFFSCAEFRDLKKAVDQYRQNKQKASK